jgi:PAS domain S-box-containing protein
MPTPDEIRLQIDYRDLVETVQDGIFQCDETGRLTFVNHAMTNLLGCHSSALSGQRLSAFVDAEHQAALSDLFDETKNRRRSAQGEFHFHLPNGSQLWGRMTIQPLYHGQHTGLLTDITPQKEAQFVAERVKTRLETDLDDRQAMLSLQVQHMPIGCICWDKSFRIRSWNPAAARIFGYPEQEVLGQDPFGLIVSEDVRPWVMEVWHRLLNGEQSVPSTNENMTKDRRSLLCSWTNTPLRDKQGNVIGVLSMVEDITVRTRAEQNFRIKNAQLESVSQALLSYLQEENWSKVSRRLLHSALLHTRSQYGFLGVVTPGPILRILCHEGVTWGPDNREFFEAALRTYQEVGYLEFSAFDNLFGRVITDEQPILSNDPANDPRAAHRLPAGHPPLQNFLGVPIRHGSRIVGLLGVANHPRGYSEPDLALVETLTQAAGILYDNYLQRESAQALAREKETLMKGLVRAEKLASLGTLLGGIAHELNNPLFIAQGYLRLAQENLQEGATEQTARDLAILEQTLGRASDILARFLKATREGPALGRRCQVNKVVQEVVEMLSNTLLIRQVHVVLNLSPDLPDAACDGLDFAQVVLNLLTNAYQALEKRSDQREIRVSSRLVTLERTACIEVTVGDNGPGIPEHDLPYIFDPFFTTKPVGQGTGLGLSISHQIVAGEGGTLTCHSTQGIGTIFTIALKVVEQTAPDNPIAVEKESTHG